MSLPFDDAHVLDTSQIAGRESKMILPCLSAFNADAISDDANGTVV
jgi:hypothetical protein